MVLPEPTPKHNDRFDRTVKILMLLPPILLAIAAIAAALKG